MLGTKVGLERVTKSNVGLGKKQHRDIFIFFQGADQGHFLTFSSAVITGIYSV